MIVGFLGTRGTVPSAEVSTVSLVVDNRFVFDVSSEFVQAFERYRDHWKTQRGISTERFFSQVSNPTFARLDHFFLSHLHWDHWGGLRHLVHRAVLLEREQRLEKPMKIYIPEGSCKPFLRRMADFLNLEDSSILPQSSKDMLRMLLITEIGTTADEVVRIEEIAHGETLQIEKGYTITANRTSHLQEGSVTYKIQHSKTKLNEKAAEKLEIPKNKTLSKLKMSPEGVMIGGRLVHQDDVFQEITTTVSYSGDTPIDNTLLDFFQGTDLLIHEATYLSEDESYYLDSHSSFPKLLEYCSEISSLRAVAPVHFSSRYKWEEIKEIVKGESSLPFQVILPRSPSIISVDPSQIVVF